MLIFSPMKKKDAKAYFGTNAAISRALGITVQAVGGWGDIVPYYSAVQLMKATHGALKVNDNDYDRLGKPKVRAA